MPRIRTFIGIDPGKAIRSRLVALQENLARAGADVKWVEPDNLHVTLLFLGEVEDRDVPQVCRTVEETVAGLQAFELTIERAGCFPNRRRPRVLWVGVGRGLQETVTLHDVLEPPLLDLGCYRREDRQYTPHITLGRVRSERPSEKLVAALAKYEGFQAGETVIDEIQVMSSQLSSNGPTYTVMSRAKLPK